MNNRSLNQTLICAFTDFRVKSHRNQCVIVPGGIQKRVRRHRNVPKTSAVSNRPVGCYEYTFPERLFVRHYIHVTFR